MLNRRNIMRDAWRLARKGARRYGGRVRLYLAAALRIAWRKLTPIRRVVRFAVDTIRRIVYTVVTMKQTVTVMTRVERKLTKAEREHLTAWLQAMSQMLREQWIGFRSEREALARAKVRLEAELYGPFSRY